MPVVLRDLDEAIVERALETIRDELADAAARGRLDHEQALSLAAQATGTTSYDGFEDCDFVIEAVFEELDVKRQVFGELEEVVPDELRARDEHVRPLGDRDGRGPRAPGAPPRHALLQPGRPDAARRARSHTRDGRHRGGDGVGGRGQAPQAAGARSRRARLRRQPAADPHDARRPRVGRARATRSRRRTRASSCSACRWRRPCCCRWSASRSRPTFARRSRPRSRTASRSRNLESPTGRESRSVEEIRDAVLGGARGRGRPPARGRRRRLAERRRRGPPPRRRLPVLHGRPHPVPTEHGYSFELSPRA